MPMGQATGYEHLTESRFEWSKKARCAGQPEIFVQKRGRPSKNPPWRNFCGACPVIENCLAFAIVHNEFGVWGGTTHQQRKILNPLVKVEMTQQAIAAGWFEPSVLRENIQQESEVRMGPVLDLEFDFQFDF